MRRSTLLWIVCLLIVSGEGCPSVFSQEALLDRPWTLEDCIQVALKSRPELEISNLDILHSDFQIKEAFSHYYPRLNMTLGYSHFNGPSQFEVDLDLRGLKNQVPPDLRPFLPDFLKQEFEIGKTDWFAVTFDLIQPIYTFGRIEEGVRQARIGRTLSHHQKEKKKNEIVLEVKKAYYQYLLALESLTLLREAETRSNVVVQMVKIAYETAVPEKEEKGTTRLDYLKARHFHSELKIKLSETEKNAKLAEMVLKMAMGLNSDAPLLLAGKTLEACPKDRDDPESVKARALARNMDLKGLDLGVQFYGSKRKAAAREYLPKLGIQGQYIGPEDRMETKNYWYVGIGMQMPLFEGFLTRAKVGQAEVQLQKIKGQKLLAEKALSLQVDHLQATLKELGERIEIFRNAIQEAQERMSLASDGYAVGITEYEDILQAQKSEIELRAGRLQSLFLYQVSKAEIESLSGLP